jgi:glycosyltransferase involved in cell wall biosynthesis
VRIAITADPELPVPPRFYGGIERVVHALASGLVERGHDVTVFAHPDSTVPGTLRPYPVDRSDGAVNIVRNAWRVSSGVLRGRFDVVHSFGRLAYIAPLLPARIPVLMTYQRPITANRVNWAIRLSHGSIAFSACSRHLLAPVGAHANRFVVYNGVSEASYTCTPSVGADAPLVFLGRVEHIKGPHLAIDVARRAGRRLVIAGNVPAGPEHRAFFANEIQPRLDGDRIRYVGPVDDRAKNELLGTASALLMPVLWDEPFGIVMAEALACGVPVIGLNRGSVPEVVQQGVNGFVCDSVEDMVSATGRLGSIDRGACRQTMEERFSNRVMIDAYEAIYAQLTAACGAC